MPELRQNRITGHWVIIAENRGGRPRDFVVQQTVRNAGECPFCEGHEELTPGEVFAIRDNVTQPDTPGWRVRVIPNKYPATTMASEGSNLAPAGRPGTSNALSQSLTPGTTLHEVIIESPRHVLSLAALDDAQAADILAAYRTRIAQLGISHPQSNIILFKNSGPAAGATLAHLHSQLVASTLLTADQRARLAAFGAQPGYTVAHPETCSACEMVAQLPDALVVAHSPHFIAFCPHAARFPYETWVLPLRHEAHYDRLDPETLPELASLFRGVLVKLERILQVPAYNYILHTAPFDTARADHYHWHIEILPRITTLGGFELGTGCYINPLSPEHAAEELRGA